MFASWLLIFLVIVLLSVVSRFSALPIDAVLVGCILAYLVIFFGRVSGAMKHVNLLYVPVLIGICTTLAIPLLPYFHRWIEPHGVVKIDYDLVNVAETLAAPKEKADDTSMGDSASYSRKRPNRATADNGQVDDAKVIQSMNADIQEAAQIKKGMKLPTKEELEEIKRQRNELLNQ
jgi:hypothetical protein